MMQISCSTSVFASFDDDVALIEDSLRCARSAGISTIALDASCLPIERTSSGQASADEDLFQLATAWHRAAAELSIEVSQVVSSVIDLTGVESAEAGLRWIEFANSLGVKSVMLSLVGAQVDRVDPTAAKCLHAWGDCANAAGSIVSLGTASSVLPDTRAMAQLMNATRASSLRLDFDTGRYQQWNPHRSGEIALQRIAGWLGSLRLREATGTPGEFDSPPLGTGGAVDFARTCEIVKALKFRGPVIIEIDPPTRRKALRSIESDLSDSLQHLRDCGWYG